MASDLNAYRFRDPRFLLMYSALQFGPEEQAKPDGSLSLPYVAGALRRAGYAVSILDVSVGGPEDRLEDTFFKTTLLPSGLIRCGMSPERIAKAIADYDVIGISSIFTTQTQHGAGADPASSKQVDPSQAGHCGRRERAEYAPPLLRRRRRRDRPVAKPERTIVEIAEAVRGRSALTDGARHRLPRRDRAGGRQPVPAPSPMNLDDLPFPAWDLLPLDEVLGPVATARRPVPARASASPYASLQTSRGCPFQCLYCHISKETDDDVAGTARRASA